MYFGVLFLVMMLMLRIYGQPSRHITAFVQSPDGVLASDTTVSFTCRAMVSNVYWMVNGVRMDNATANSGVQIMTTLNDQNSTVSILLTRTKSNENNTNVTCIASDTSSSIVDRHTAIIVQAAPPLPPFLHLSLFSNGTVLRAEWERPFAMSGYPVTSYTLDIINKTSGLSSKIILDQGLSTATIYDLLSTSIPTSCHPISFSVIATNSIGGSSASNIVTSGFPIFPQTDHVVLHVDFNINLSPTLLTVTFPRPAVCAFQEPATYTVGIFDADGEEVVLTKTRPANSSLVVERIEAVLERGESYSAELTIQHQHVPGEAFITFIGIDFTGPRPTEETTTEGNGASPLISPMEKTMLLTALLIIISIN